MLAVKERATAARDFGFEALQWDASLCKKDVVAYLGTWLRALIRLGFCGAKAGGCYERRFGHRATEHPYDACGGTLYAREHAFCIVGGIECAAAGGRIEEDCMLAIHASASVFCTNEDAHAALAGNVYSRADPGAVYIFPVRARTATEYARRFAPVRASFNQRRRIAGSRGMAAVTEEEDAARAMIRGVLQRAGVPEIHGLGEVALLVLAGRGQGGSGRAAVVWGEWGVEEAEVPAAIRFAIDACDKPIMLDD